MEWQGLIPPTLAGFTGFVPPAGTGSYGVALIGEAPGEQEARYSVPFYEHAPAGATLSRLLRRAGLERDGFVISNAVWSRPPGNYLENASYEGAAIAGYQAFRERLFELYRPRVLVALGNVALKTLTGYGGGGKSGITNVQGYVMDGPWSGTWVVPTYHPSYIMRGKSELSGVVIWALQRALDIAKNGFVRLPTRYITHPSLDDALTFERNYDAAKHFLSYDIETFESSNLDEEEVEDRDEDISFNITRISLCYSGQDGYAISLPWQAPFIEIARRMLSSTGSKRVWNGNFDNPRLAAAACPVAGRIYDAMWAWKFLQPTLPRSLGFVAPFYGWSGEPWKHTSDSEPERYSCQDAHALQLIADGVDEHLRQKGQWHVYERHVVQLGEVLSKMSDNGLPYSAEKAAAFGAELQAKWDARYAELQARVPESIKPSKQKTGYKKEPKDTCGLVQREFNDLDESMNVVRVLRWCKLEEFLPTSPLQVRLLIQHFGHKVGTNRKTKKDTSDDDTLKKLLKKTRGSKKPRDLELGELLTLVRECRQLSKVQGTYVKGWKPGRDGRIHATPGHWGKMFRVSWRRPNISATIQDKQEEYIAQGFRKCVATQEGKTLLEADWKGIEAVLVGWFAGDSDYMRLARLGVHDYMGIYMSGGTVDLTLDDAVLKAMFRDFKRAHPKLRDDAKHTVHGTNYGMGPRLMSDMYEMTEKEAKRLQGLYFDLFPKIQTWQRSVLDRASRECKLRNPFGYEMSFWEVFKWDQQKYQRLLRAGVPDALAKQQAWALGEDAKSAIAFLPRDTAAAMLKEVLPRLRPLADSGTMIASTHDSITCEIVDGDLMRVAAIVKGEMERPVKELNDLVVGVELKVGSSWHADSMSVLELPDAQEQAPTCATTAIEAQAQTHASLVCR